VLAFATAAMIGAACSSSSSLPPSASCDSGPVMATGVNVVSAAGEDVDSTCAAVSHEFAWKAGAAGSACSDPLDCAPVCCVCPGRAAHALATWCDQGLCAAPADVCCMVLGTTLKACAG